MNNEELIMNNKKLSEKINKTNIRPVGAGLVSAQENATHGITLIAFAISRKCVRYEERA